MDNRDNNLNCLQEEKKMQQIQPAFLETLLKNGNRHVLRESGPGSEKNWY